MKIEFTKETLAGISVRTCRLNTVVVGTGAAGFNAALRLHEGGLESLAIVTEGVTMGTSRNTGSDKQTYYKMNLCADYPDSPAAMAKDLFAGKCVDGDIAYAEAACSVRGFLHLAELGVPFPVNSLGEYVGYKTDHDPRARATSVGPLTSKYMTECLERAVNAAGVPILDGLTVISILKDGKRVVGLLALDKKNAGHEDERFVLLVCRNVIWATGGPAGMYADSVYPTCHTGSSGVAFEAGIPGRNLTEWQYGLASVDPRWNVSGTYMQVLPRFVSVDPDGTEHEFLSEYFTDIGTCLSKIFRKGYEWPFDSRKALTGSSVIDLLVFRETKLRGRRVFLDYRKNPAGYDDLPFEKMDAEALDYLTKAGALFGTPIERLLHMNSPAVDLYRSKGVDLRTEMLEIALCAQHNNGGLDIDIWWQTPIDGFFAAGEVAGSHGVYRPGGSALNAGQVGSMRAAQYVLQHGAGEIPSDACMKVAEGVVAEHLALSRALMSRKDTTNEALAAARRRMSRAGGAIRNRESLTDALNETRAELAGFADRIGAGNAEGLVRAYCLRDTLIAQKTYLTAMLDYLDQSGLSRGSALYTDPEGTAATGLEDIFRFRPDDGRLDGQIQTVTLTGGGETVAWRPVRPLPEGGGFFENVWRSYRENQNVIYPEGEER